MSLFSTSLLQSSVIFTIPTKLENGIAKFCNDFGVDVEYEKDRVAFFTALIKEMKYQ
jgi:hypothetical protein